MPLPNEISIETASRSLIAIFSALEPANFSTQEDPDRLKQYAKKYAQKIANSYNYVRIFGMSQEVPLLSLYVRLQILEKISAYTSVNLEDLERIFQRDTKSFNKSNETLDVAATLNQHQKCMILGKPGAGKSTLLKYIALNSLLPLKKSGFKRALLPIFITLKEFADQDRFSLLEFIANEFARCGMSEDLLVRLLDTGKCRLLLDGLDEVPEQALKKTVEAVVRFTESYADNQYLITCRMAAYNHQFQRFTDVEVADFDDQQQEAFIQNWFKSDPQSATHCWEKLESDASIRELAGSPLLLTLLCIAFEENFDFPSNRALIYKDASDALLKKWDSSRQINRGELYKELSLPRKQLLLSQMAFETFIENRYFVREQQFCDIIGQFLDHLNGNTTTLPRATTDNSAILRGMAAQHGIVTERAHYIYSFSHLTLQEYFTAEYVVANNLHSTIAQNYLNHDRWREVFLLTTNLLQTSQSKSDAFFTAMYRQLQTQVQQNPCLSQLFNNIHTALLAEQDNMNAPLVLRRIVTVCLYLDRIRDLDRTLDLDLTLDLILDLTLDQALDIDRDMDRDLDLHLDVYRDLDLDLDPYRDRDLDLDSLQKAVEQASLLSPQDLAILKEYLSGCRRLVACLRTESYLSTAVREAAWDSICQPPPLVSTAETTLATASSINVFYSYHLKDASICELLDRHLASLKRSGLIRTWDKRLLSPGDTMSSVTQQRFEEAQVILLLISADFMDSDELWEQELQPAMDRHRGNKALVVPIIVRECKWETSILRELQALPRKVAAIQMIGCDEDTILREVVDELERAIEQFMKIRKN